MKHAEKSDAKAGTVPVSHWHVTKRRRFFINILVPLRNAFHVPVGCEDKMGFFLGEFPPSPGPTDNPATHSSPKPHPAPVVKDHELYNRRIP